jgi:4-diphosphocytidyl-2-C-methyl-D-erythritol kinase
MINHLTLPAPGKLNLFLHILGRRPDGYHNIQTVFQFVDWCDTLHFERRNDNKIQLHDHLTGVAPQQNLVTIAAQQLQKATGVALGADIWLKKHLPLGAGMGGGSANAATTLLALDRLWQTNLSHSALMTIGKGIGADVPIFIDGHAAWATGIGDQLTPLVLPEPWYVLLIPAVSIGTASFFQDPRLTRDSTTLTIDHYYPGQGKNDFEPLARADHPEIAQALNWLGQFASARMTGTGSVVFAGFDSKEEAGTIANLAPSSYQVQVVKGRNQSPLHKVLST